MTRKLLTSILLVLVLLFVAACGGNAPAASSATPASTAQPAASAEEGDSKPAAASKPTASGEADAPTATPSTAAEGETRDIQDISNSLDALSSYRLRFNFSFDGKDDQGKPQKGGMEFLQEMIKASKDRHIRFTATGDAAQNSGSKGAFELFQVGGTTFIYSPDGPAEQKCISMTSQANTQDLGDAFKPADVIGGLKQARLVAKGETVNGIVADHYVFDQNSLTVGTFSSAKGDVWLAQDGGFLVKYLGTASGKDNFMGGKVSEGTVTWEYNVEDANQLTAVELPKECASAQPATDIPTPENATDKNSFGQVITFKSPDAPADIAAFYTKAMPGQGWTAGDVNALGDMQTLSFSKQQRTLTITITKDDAGGSSVLLNEQKGA